MRKVTNTGFTLIEVMIAVAIIAIIIAIALPSYQAQITRTRCSDGIAFLSKIMQNQERFFSNTNNNVMNLTYTDDLQDLGYGAEDDIPSPEGFYEVSAAACDADGIAACVLLTATAQDPTVDADITLDSRGQLDVGEDCE